MSEQQITVTLEADASGCLRVIRQVTRSVDTLAGKKVGNAGMPELADGAQKASGKVKQTERDIDSLSSAVSKIKGVIAGAFAVGSIYSFGKATLSAAANTELLHKGLSFVLGSSEEASRLVKNIQDIGEASAYDTTELLPLARAWVNIGDNVDTATSKMQKIVDLGSAYGLTSAQVGAVNLALTQMQMAGKIGQQDMMQLINAGIPGWQILSEKMGIPVEQLKDMSSKSLLTEDAMSQLWDGITEKTEGAASSMADTLMGKFSNAEEAVQNSMSAMGDIISQALDVPGVLDDAGVLAEGIKAHITSIRDAAKDVGLHEAIVNELEQINPAAAEMADGVMNAFTSVKETIDNNQTAVGILLEAIVAMGAAIAIINGLSSAFTVLKGAITAAALAAEANPIILAISLIVAALVVLYTHWDAVKQVIGTVRDYAVNAFGSISDTLSSFVGWLDSNIWTPVRDGAITAINFIVGLWVSLGDAIISAVSPVVDWFQSSVWEPICSAASEAWGAITELWGQFTDWFAEIMSPVSDTASEAWTVVSNAASEAWGVVSDVWGAVSGWFDSTVIEPVKQTFKTGTDYISNSFRLAYDSIVGIFGGLANWFENNVVAPIKSAFSKITSLGSSVTGLQVTTSSGGAKAAARGGVFGRFAFGGVVGGSIPALANGGQSKNGTMAIIGEAGPEAVLPLRKSVLGSIGNSISDASNLSKITDMVSKVVDEASSVSANKKNPVYNAEKAFSNATSTGSTDAYTKVLDKARQKVIAINEAQAQFQENWKKAQEEANKYADGGEKTLAFQKQMVSSQAQIAKLQDKINAGNGTEADTQKLSLLISQSQNREAEYEKDKAAALAYAQETQDGINRINADAEAARLQVKQDAINQIDSYETQLAQAQYAQKKAMMATELGDFLAQMEAKDEITGQSYATTLANEQYLAEQRRVWMNELMLSSVSWGEYMQTMLTNMAMEVQNGLASGIAECIVEGRKFSEVMSNLAKTLLKQLIQGVVQKLIAGWITAIGLGRSRHKEEIKNTATESAALGAKLSLETGIAAAAAAAAHPWSPASAAATAVKAVTAATIAGAALGKAAMAAFKVKESGSDSGSDTSDIQLPKMAKGGVVTGPTAALIGEGRYNEAVLPLKPALLERIFGTASAGQNTVVATQNVYGDINTRADEEDLFNGLNDQILSGLRGA